MNNIAEIPKLVMVRGLPSPESEGFYATLKNRYERYFNGVIDFEPKYADGNLRDERKRFFDEIGDDLEEGVPVSVLALSGGAPFAVGARSIRPETDPIRIAAIAGRLNNAQVSGFRTLDEIRKGVSPLLAESVESLGSDGGNLTPAMRDGIASYTVAEGDELVHPSMTTLYGAHNEATDIIAENHADGIGQIVWRRRGEIIGFLNGRVK